MANPRWRRATYLSPTEVKAFLSQETHPRWRFQAASVFDFFFFRHMQPGILTCSVTWCYSSQSSCDPCFIGQDEIGVWFQAVWFVKSRLSVLWVGFPFNFPHSFSCLWATSPSSFLWIKRIILSRICHLWRTFACFSTVCWILFIWETPAGLLLRWESGYTVMCCYLLEITFKTMNDVREANLSQVYCDFWWTWRLKCVWGVYMRPNVLI